MVIIFSNSAGGATMGFKIEGLDDVTADDAALSDLLTAPVGAEVGQDGELGELGELAADPDPGYAPPALEDRIFGDPDRPARRVSQTVRKDIRGKIAMLLVMVGGGLAARDPHCGGAVLDAIADHDTPEGPQDGIATALADLVCDSPDMVKWFTSSGRYLKWFNLALAIQPVVQMGFAHHVSHSVSDEDQGDDWGRYAAS
jgi:hypothetical protein